jgi:hypothetical protein
MIKYPVPKITEKIIVKKNKSTKKIINKTEKYLDNVLSKKFLQSYFKKYN